MAESVLDTCPAAGGVLVALLSESALPAQADMERARCVATIHRQFAEAEAVALKHVDLPAAGGRLLKRSCVNKLPAASAAWTMASGVSGVPGHDNLALR